MWCADAGWMVRALLVEDLPAATAHCLARHHSAWALENAGFSKGGGCEDQPRPSTHGLAATDYHARPSHCNQSPAATRPRQCRDPVCLLHCLNPAHPPRCHSLASPQTSTWAGLHDPVESQGRKLWCLSGRRLLPPPTQAFTRTKGHMETGTAADL